MKERLIKIFGDACGGVPAYDGFDDEVAAEQIMQQIINPLREALEGIKNEVDSYEQPDLGYISELCRKALEE